MFTNFYLALKLQTLEEVVILWKNMKNVNLVEINLSELESFKKNCPIWGNEDLLFTSNYTAEEDEMATYVGEEDLESMRAQEESEEEEDEQKGG
mgnify:CR=1 FL=1